MPPCYLENPPLPLLWVFGFWLWALPFWFVGFTFWFVGSSYWLWALPSCLWAKFYYYKLCLLSHA